MTCALFIFKQDTAYGLRMSDWCSDVCCSDLRGLSRCGLRGFGGFCGGLGLCGGLRIGLGDLRLGRGAFRTLDQVALLVAVLLEVGLVPAAARTTERRRGHLAADLPGRAAGRASVGKRAGQLLQAVEDGFAGGTAGGEEWEG